MKNKYREQQKLTQRIAGKGQRKGFYFPHSYEHKDKNSLTFWDDLTFYLNGIRYIITFVHPRCKYVDTCEQLVYDKMLPSRPESEMSFVPYKKRKLGKSRKKTTLFSMEETNKEALEEWHKKLWQEEKEFLKVSDVTIVPSVSVKSWNHSKNIDLCAPYEIRSEADARFLTEMVRESYKAGTLYTWVAQMKTIKYSRDNWNAEQGDKDG